jgi:hypothetical protein
MTNAPAPPPVSRGNPARRPLLLGVAIGLLVPMVAFLALSAGMTAGERLGSAVWSVVAFVGVALLFFERTRRVGVGMLLGFGCLLLTGAGACTVIFAVG